MKLNIFTRTVLIIQTVLALSGIVVFAFNGFEAALAAFYGSAIHMVATFLMHWRLFPPHKELSVKQFYQQLYAAEVQKMALTFVLVWLGVAILSLAAVPLTIMFIITSFAYWLAMWQAKPDQSAYENNRQDPRQQAPDDNGKGVDNVTDTAPDQSRL